MLLELETSELFTLDELFLLLELEIAELFELDELLLELLELELLLELFGLGITIVEFLNSGSLYLTVT